MPRVYPKYPPCIPSKNGKGDTRKTVEAFSKQCAAYCGRKVQNLGRKVTRQTKLTVAQRNAISKIKRTRISENNKRMFIKLIKNGENIKRVQKGVSRAREMYENRANKYV